VDNVVYFKAPESAGIDVRARFEKWAGSQLSKIERETFFIRSKGGEYVRPSMRMAWASWQAAIADMIELYVAETQS
jgi:hypothetical protein